MRAFARLLDRLAFTPARNGKLTLLRDYFATAPDPERGWALASLTGVLSFNEAKPQFVRKAVEARIDQINQITDYTKAQQAWGDLDAQIGELALTVPLYTANDVVLHGTAVRNTYVDQWRGWYDISSVSVK